MFNYFRFRWRRAVRRARRNTRIWRQWSRNYIDRHIWGKWHQVRVVRRFLLLWWALAAVAFVGLLQQMGALDRLYTTAVGFPGGTYTEAAVGTVQTLNPLLPESATADDINRLVFSGLTRYNSRRQHVPDLATSWDVSPDGKTYTFHLRHGVKWHDGVPFTSADVAFTLTAIQNPDSRSPLASSWQGVTCDTPDNYTVVMKLPQPLDSFLDSTTVGIVPRHLLENVEPSQLREADFNQNPVGTGPFKLKTFAPSAKEIELTANPNYYFGKPKLDEFMFKFYDTPAQTLTAYAARQVTSPGRIEPEVASQARSAVGLTEYTFTLPEETTLFFATGDSTLKDKTLRLILSRSIDRGEVMQQASAGQGVAVTQPILPGQTGYTNQYYPGPLSSADAKKALVAAGYKPGQLHLRLVTLAGSPLELAAKDIQHQWSALGINLSITAVDQNELQQTYMRPRNFQMLLYGVNLGSDPDVYSFWHSSQAKDPGVNLSGYSSLDADSALESGRVKSDPLVRQGKYEEFLKAWDADAPAAVLYESAYVYAASSDVSGIMAHRLVAPADRFYGVERWTVRRRLIPIR
ncbi:MAG TPA: ABC transporter substrate-binding protein [Candidatus Saccharimonadia bacterium]|jgi:peptide/nickel transport system substrate-binding protein